MPLQTYDCTTTPYQGRKNVERLKAELALFGLDGFIVPHEDEFQNEYLPAANERLAWLSGFTGSAGAALVLQDRAILFTDGRYTVQSRQQTDPNVFEHEDFHANAVANALSTLKAGQKIGYDPRLISCAGFTPLAKAASLAGLSLIACDDSPLDRAWGEDRPPLLATALFPYPLEFAGLSHAQKRSQCAENLARAGADACLITQPSSLCWLLNVRASDVVRTPLALGYVLLEKSGKAHLFVALDRLDEALRQHLGDDVLCHAPEAIIEVLAGFAGKTILIDQHSTAITWQTTLTKLSIAPLLGEDPCLLARACKNTAEREATRAAHLRDGAVMCQFLHWLETEAQTTLPSEIEVAQKLEALRVQTGKLRDLSFDTISGFGPNGALPHYRVTTESNLKTQTGSLLLVDSGAQYQDGTTDITRVVAFGAPRDDHKRLYTLVLKGHIALATIRFPKGTTGTHLDVLARQFLWQEGFDYDHGTGHGVGVFLGVHEGPQRIAKVLNAYELREGMIVSNEPGYYKEGDFGIRIENLQMVTPLSTPKGGERPMFGFETLTFAPFARNLIDVTLLSEAERAYVDGYHQAVLEKLSPLVDGVTRDWLKEACAAL